MIQLICGFSTRGLTLDLTPYSISCLLVRCLYKQLESRYIDLGCRLGFKAGLAWILYGCVCHSALACLTLGCASFLSLFFVFLSYFASYSQPFHMKRWIMMLWYAIDELNTLSYRLGRPRGGNILFVLYSPALFGYQGTLILMWMRCIYDQISMDLESYRRTRGSVGRYSQY